MEEIRTILLCGNSFAFPVMHQLVFHNQLKAVVIPARCREFIAEAKQLLTAADIPVITVQKKDFETIIIETIKKQDANFGLMLSFGYTLPSSVFNLPSNGFYNIHPGPLPEYRGPDPVFQLIKNREKFAAVTVHKVNEELDCGEIVLQEKIKLSPADTHGILTAKLAQQAGKLADTLIKILQLGFTVPTRPQDESKAHYYKKQSTEDVTIKWAKMSADEMIALINACNPHNKGAVTKVNNKVIRLLHAEKGENTGTEALSGTILSIDDQVLEVAVSNKEAIMINFLHIDEGYITPSRLKELGLAAGMRFENFL